MNRPQQGSRLKLVKEGFMLEGDEAAETMP